MKYRWIFAFDYISLLLFFLLFFRLFFCYGSFMETRIVLRIFPSLFRCFLNMHFCSIVEKKTAQTKKNPVDFLFTNDNFYLRYRHLRIFLMWNMLTFFAFIFCCYCFFFCINCNMEWKIVLMHLANMRQCRRRRFLYDFGKVFKFIIVLIA